MKKQQLFDALSQLDEQYLEEAVQFSPAKRRLPRVAKISIIAAALVIVLCATVTAVNLDWSQQIRQWLGIESEEVAGFIEAPSAADPSTGDNQEVPGLDVQSAEGSYLDSQEGNGDVSLLASFVSGNRLVAYFSVTPKDGAALDPDMSWSVSYPEAAAAIEEDPNGFYSHIVSEDVVVKSQSSEETVLELTLTCEKLEPEGSLAVQLYQFGAQGESCFYPALDVPLAEAPTLHASPDLAVHNEAADADGILNDVAVSAGNIELTLNHEYVEAWCDRVCVPDQGKVFMEAYTGAPWDPGTPTDGAHFTQEDEGAIFSAYEETWNKTASELVSTIVLHLKDGSAVPLGEPQEENYSFTASLTEHDATVYRWILNPVLDLDQVESIEILGEIYPAA